MGKTNIYIDSDTIAFNLQEKLVESIKEDYGLSEYFNKTKFYNLDYIKKSLSKAIYNGYVRDADFWQQIVLRDDFKNFCNRIEALVSFSFIVDGISKRDVENRAAILKEMPWQFETSLNYVDDEKNVENLEEIAEGRILVTGSVNKVKDSCYDIKIFLNLNSGIDAVKMLAGTGCFIVDTWEELFQTVKWIVEHEEDY